MKNVRQEAIIRIISEFDIETQQDLIEALRREGYPATQATVSRDIKELCLIKEQTPNGKSRYTAGVTPEDRDKSVRLRTIFRECVISCSLARNIIVIKTLPGLASAACSAIDGMNVRNFAGSVAGDDTAFLAMTDEQSAEKFSIEIENLLK